MTVLLQAGCEPTMSTPTPIRREAAALLAKYEAAWKSQEAVSYYNVRPRDVPSVVVVDFVGVKRLSGQATQAILDEARGHSRLVEGFDPESHSFLRTMATCGVNAMFIKGVSSIGGLIRGAAMRERSAARLTDIATRSSALVSFMYLANGWWGTKSEITVLLVSSTSEELDATQRTFTDAAAAWGSAGGRGVLTLSPWEDAVSDDGSVPATSAVMQWVPSQSASGRHWSIRLLAASPTQSSGAHASHTLAAKVVEVFGVPNVAIMTGSTAALAQNNRLCDVLIAHSAFELRSGVGGASAVDAPAGNLDISGAAHAWESGNQAIDTYLRLDRHRKVWEALWMAVSTSPRHEVASPRDVTLSATGRQQGVSTVEQTVPVSPRWQRRPALTPATDNGASASDSGDSELRASAGVHNTTLSLAEFYRDPPRVSELAATAARAMLVVEPEEEGGVIGGARDVRHAGIPVTAVTTGASDRGGE